MKRKAWFLALGLMLTTLTGTALAASYADENGDLYGADAVRDADRAAYYELEAPARPAPMAAAGETALIPLGDPTDLRWDPNIPGNLTFTVPAPTQNQFLFSVYLEGQPDAPVWETRMDFGPSGDPDPGTSYFTSDLFRTDLNIQKPDGHRVPGGRLGSGDYYFTVQNLGDGVTYSDSAVISSLDTPDGSGVYHYVEPESALDTPPQGHWEWPAACWEGPAPDWDSGYPVLGQDSRYRGFFLEYGYTKDPGGEIESIGGSSPNWSGFADPWLQNKLIGENGAGWYYFRVRALSADIEQWRNGDWSDWSEGYNLLEASQKITEALNAIDKTAPAEDIRQKVQALNKTELKNALTADILEAATGAADALAALEDVLGGPAQPQVTDAALAEVFDPAQVSIVGAALNDLAGTEPPALNIGRAKQDNHVRDELYNSTLAVDFSMELSGVEAPHDLAVPVKVTLPIPETIHPDFLVVLHYQLDGNYEEVLHTVFQDGGRWYASFVLTSFSDFTLTELLAEEGGPSIQTGPDGSYEASGVPEGAKLYLARYEGGRFQSLEELKSLSGTLTGSGAKKLFLLDEAFRPLCAAGII